MKNRLFFFSLLSTLLCLVLYHIMLVTHFKVIVPLKDLVLYGLVPVLLMATFLHLYFVIISWAPLEKYLSSLFPNSEIQTKNLLSFWKEIISEYKQKQKDQEEMIRFYKNIFEHLEEGIIIVGDKGKIQYNNLSAQEILRFPGQVKNKYFWEILQNLEVKNQINQAIEKNTKFTGEYVLHSPLGKTISYLITPMGDSFQSRTGNLLIVASDVSKLKKLEQIRTDFVSNVSHELKSPLGAILGYVETLMDEPGLDPDRRKKFLDVIYKNGIHLNAIVDDLLILSKLESDKTLLLTRFSPSKLLNEVIELYTEKIKEQHLIIKSELMDETIEMSADKVKIRQIMINLLDNAIKYSNEGGEINLSLERKNNQIVFTIADNGVGIPFLDQDRIFERFYRVDKARSGDKEGTGLGLSIVKHIVDLHHGLISFTSTRNEGTTFFVTIPQNLTES